ncbi:MAG: hypothetical protein ACI3ZL_04785 [Candidatus Cryptobacteroides sp.]
MAIKSKKYDWTFENIGGSTRVKITSGEDIAHLEELDPKMWTVLSCPVSGLEIDEKSLRFVDCDSDGRIRVNDIIRTSKWITSVVKDPNIILGGSDRMDTGCFNAETPEGKKLQDSSRQILRNLGKDEKEISLADTADIAAIFAKTRFNGDGIITEASSDDADDKAAISAAIATMGSVTDRSGAPGVDAAMIEGFYKNLADYSAWLEAAVKAPYGDDTEKALAAYNALDAKVKDFFLRSRLAKFSPASASALDIQTSRIESISGDNLTAKTDEIASYPLAHIDGKSEIDLEGGINPAWAADFGTLKKIAIKPGKKVLTEEDWNAIGQSFAEYSAWKAAKAGAAVESLGADSVKDLLAKDRKAALLELVAKDAALKDEADNIENVDKFLHLLRDFGRLLRNFVTFQDFYDKDRDTLAVFQCGTLLIDQRACRFCMKVADMGKHNSMAASSGMFLVYCDCTTKDKAGKLQIVAAVTVGDIGDLVVGKNAIFYDNAGVEWDAVITKIIDNPISISQAFWSPYRRMATAIENLINKNAAEKDAKIMKEATDKINAVPSKAPSEGAAKAEAQPFDIGKFAGIFAALGMALGMIGTALASLAKGIFALTWWQLILSFVGIILVISGPAMIMAWMKLRRRNIAPLLNANGWAINASSKISIMFGETLTDIAKFPKLQLKDPYAKKGIAPWKKWTISAACLVLVLAVLWLCNLFAWAKLPSPLPCFDKDEAVESVEAPAQDAMEDVADE